MLGHVADNIAGHPAANGHHHAFSLYAIRFALFIVSDINIISAVGRPLMTHIDDGGIQAQAQRVLRPVQSGKIDLIVENFFERMATLDRFRQHIFKDMPIISRITAWKAKGRMGRWF